MGNKKLVQNITTEFAIPLINNKLPIIGVSLDCL